jgi:hypothetical protein
MDYQLIANILLAVAACFSLVLMLRWDMLKLQQLDYSGKEFMTWLQESDESYSTKRIVPMAALVACATPWARQSWMVVALIAIAMLGLGIVLLRTKHERPLEGSKRVTFTLLGVMTVVAICTISLFSAHFELEAGMLLMLFTAFSYVLTLGANWVANLFSKKKQ